MQKDIPRLEHERSPKDRAQTSKETPFFLHARVGIKLMRGPSVGHPRRVVNRRRQARDMLYARGWRCSLLPRAAGGPPRRVPAARTRAR
jgi:hypothetical protein